MAQDDTDASATGAPKPESWFVPPIVVPIALLLVVVIYGLTRSV